MYTLRYQTCQANEFPAVSLTSAPLGPGNPITPGAPRDPEDPGGPGRPS